MIFHKTTLDSGLRVITAPMPNTRSVAISIYLGAGARSEADSEIGAAHFLEHLFFKGTSNRPTAKEISEAIEGVGGIMNAGTDRELTVYWCKVGRPHWELALDVLADMLRNASFDPEELEKERAVVIEEISMIQDQPGEWVGTILDELMWPGQALGRDIAGTPDEVRSLSRNTITGYVARHYGPENAVVSVAGDLEHEAVLSAVGAQFDGWSPVVTESWAPTTDDQSAARVKIAYKETEQTHLCLAVPGLHQRHPQRYALDMLNVMLGEGMSSRLFLEVREKRGLAYDVGSFTSHYSDAGSLVVYAGVDPKRVESAIEGVIEQLDGVRETVTEEELVKAKEFTKGRMFMRMEDSRVISSSFGAQELLLGEIKTVDEIADLIDGVTLGEVKTVAQQLLRGDRLNLAIVGPVRDEERLLSLLRL